MVKIIENSGETPETALVILEAANTIQGVSAEYDYVTKLHGRRGVDWNLISQSLMEKDGKNYDVLHLQLSNGKERTLYFDITGFFGKY